MAHTMQPMGASMKAKSQPKILCVEDDPIMQLMLKDVVRSVGAELVLAASAHEAQERLAQDQFDLALLDRQLPDSDGLLLVQDIANSSGCAVVILSGLSDTRDKLLGIGLGAIEYLTKPINPLELSARIKSILTYTQHDAPEETQEVFDLPTLTFDARTRQLDVNGNVYFVAPTEARLLHSLLSKEGEVQHRDQLYEAACSRGWSHGDRTIDVLISRLRRKLAHAAVEIVTVHRTGYLLRRRVT